ncbi:D-2-hydroxyacid dehydrogenase [Spirosoma sordidisoli]|uniref:D-2-hydroxyacid dehydrogenase n=1 Tax=Spirosoma sordidisoli TaxID=2502893 RepID=A0A4V1RWY4_9BACT|nr:D-2-hydroxyacid dehydrogenase [Spirosoma sordidisoli]RYC71878.1 D-2-hydroxyacid dehydrogenase [Spirosoma sordidisoli]
MIAFVYTNLNEAYRSQLRQQLPEAVEPIFRNELSAEQYQPAFRSADIVLGNPPADWWTNPPVKLQYWQLDSAGFDGYQGVQVKAQVANMGDYFAWPCAETIVAGILAHYRHIDELAVLQSQRQWSGSAVRAKLGLLRRKQVIILGSGAIGQAVRQMLLGFDCSVRLLARTDPAAELHSVDELKAALPATDLVVSTLPGSAKGLFSAELIGAMKPGSVFANVGRGSTVDEPALIAALQTGQLGGAVLDVTATEPLPTDSPFWTLPNVVLTQHTAGGQPNEDAGKVDLFLRNLSRFLDGLPLENAVELGKGY